MNKFEELRLTNFHFQWIHCHWEISGFCVVISQSSVLYYVNMLAMPYKFSLLICLYLLKHYSYLR